MASEMILAKLSQLQGFGEKFIAKMGEVSERVRTLEAVGAQANLIERILVNGDPLSVGENKTVNIPVPTRVNQLENDASYQENVIECIQVNGVTQGITGKTVNVHMPTAVSELTNDENYQTNVLEGVKVNGTALTVDAEKNVNVSVPTKVSQLTNDKTYQTKMEVENTVKTAVAGSKHTSFQKVSSVPAAADAKEDVMYLVMNSVTKHYDIYAKIADDAGNFKMELLDDTTVDLSGYVQKEAGKGLSHNDFTDALLAKLNGIAEKANLYIHPGHTAYAEGLYKVTVDALGHVTKAVGVTKADITGLGIPGQDTHDWTSITGKPTSYPPSGHTHAWGEITGKPSTFPPSAHKHVKADISDFPASMPASDVSAWAKAATKPSYAWSEITGKPSTFTPASHTHDDRYYTESEINAKLDGKSNTGHIHLNGTKSGAIDWNTITTYGVYKIQDCTMNDACHAPNSEYQFGILQVLDSENNVGEKRILQIYWPHQTSKGNHVWYRMHNGSDINAGWTDWDAIAKKPATAGYADSAGSVAWGKITGKPGTFTPATHSHAWGDITGKPSTFAPSAHKHVKADITDFPTSLPASDVKAWAKAANKPNYSWGEITNKPSTFTPAGHKHVKADITDFPTLGTAAAKNVGDFAAASHSHSWDSVTGKPTTFAPSSHNHDDRYYTESEIDTKLSGKANSSHTHNYAGSSSAGGTAASVNGFTFGVQTSDPGANSSLTTNKFLFVYE